MLINVALVFILSVPIAVFAADKPEAVKQNKEVETLKMLDLFGDVFERVKKDYVEEVSDKDLIEYAINGMLTALDPHSSYMNEKAFDEMRIQTRGEFGGLGIEVTMDNGLVKVVSPIDDTPAHHAGIKTGDYISRIDEDAVMGMTLSEAVEKMRGKPGSKVVLTILREGEKEPLEISIVRDVIKIRAVRVQAEGDDIIYARVTSFTEQVAQNLEREIKNQLKTMGVKNKGMVLDLRNNPGGLLDQAIAVSDLFIEKGEVVSTRGRISDSNKRFNATKGDLLAGRPIVVLINGGSASASEIVAGALQDQRRAVVVGVRSFGKGSVQTVIPLSASNGAMRLTTSRYYTPSGRSIQAEGIEPDINIPQAKIETLETPKATTEANLRRHLDKGKMVEESEDSALLQRVKQEASARKSEKDGGKTKSLSDDDYQLGRAFDIIRGAALFSKK
jgi:carboxyl-terminal processing protease